MASEFITVRNDLLSKKVIKGLNSRNMTGYYAKDKDEALKLALELIPEGSTVTMGGAMSAVAADLIFFRDVGFDAVGISLRGHGQMEGRIENGDHRSAGHQLLAGAHTHNVSGIMKRSHGKGRFHIFNDSFVGDDGLREERAAVNVTMADAADFTQIADHAVIFVNESVKDHFDGDVMVFDIGFDFVFVFTGGFVGKQRIGDTDAIHKTFGHDAFVFHIDELILQRRAAAVEN